MATKAELRARFLTERQALSAAEITTRSQQIADRLIVSDTVRTLHTFLPITRRNEVNTWPIIHRLWREDPTIRVAVPVTDTETNGLAHYLLSPNTRLAENRWGIPEPTGDGLTPVSSREIDLVLVPLLAFDARGHRVGYGKGYYDRFLSGCRPDCLKVGLSLFEPVDRIDDTGPTDISLDICFTPAARFTWPSRNSRPVA